MAIERSTAMADLGNPETGAVRLMKIAQEHRDLGAEIAAHPNAYPGLIDWLQQYGSFSDVAPAIEDQGTAEEFDFVDLMMDGAASAVSAFEDFGMLEHVADASRRVRAALISLLHPGDQVQIAIPVILAAEERQEAIAIFAQDRLIVAWGGALRSKGHRVIRYSDVTAARIGAGPGELATEATLYVQTDVPTVLALPTDEANRVEFLTQVVRGVALEGLTPWSTTEPELTATTVAAVAPTTAVATVEAQSSDGLLASPEAQLENPQIAGAQLAELAAQHPELHSKIAAHPRAYPDLLDWLASRPDPSTRAAVAERRRHDAQRVALQTQALSAPPRSRTTGWEKTDTALSTAGRVTGNILAGIYGVFLVIVGIAIAVIGFSQGNGAGFIGVLVAIYGVYVALPLPGYKLIIW